ncbi:MAG: hypothetical protein M1820_000030 [Bogoriella megaspora]|nr:MAG: hypothetical protein M1820_000030 [Bogoriella megaspora]
MGKKRRLQNIHQKSHTTAPKSSSEQGRAPDSAKQANNQAKTPIPFETEDHILLVGEGDFSFARSIVEHHGCYNILATCFDSDAELKEKYPQAQDNIDSLIAEEQKVVYNVDACKLSQKEIRKSQRWDRIIFNFPHVGGKSTDVNRQVRYNQELLVAFFRAASPLLASTGTIIVTLFESEPYTLWNIRDLARHVGLKVNQSFKFRSEVYPGYQHARTLGNIEGGGAWQGEKRDARTYVFEGKDQDDKSVEPNALNRKKRRREESSDDED